MYSPRGGLVATSALILSQQGGEAEEAKVLRDASAGRALKQWQRVRLYHFVDRVKQSLG
jgi:hypothetical protein